LDAFDAARGFLGVPHDDILPTPGHRLGQLGPKKEHENPRKMGVNDGKLKLSHIGVASYPIFLNLVFDI